MPIPRTSRVLFRQWLQNSSEHMDCHRLSLSTDRVVLRHLHLFHRREWVSHHHPVECAEHRCDRCDRRDRRDKSNVIAMPCRAELLWVSALWSGQRDHPLEECHLRQAHIQQLQQLQQPSRLSKTPSALFLSKLCHRWSILFHVWSLSEILCARFRSMLLYGFFFCVSMAKECKRENNCGKMHLFQLEIPPS